MKKLLIVAVLIGLLLPLPSAAQEGQAPTERDAAFEQEIQDRLQAISPPAVPLFVQATEALDSGDLTAARQGFEQVLALAPGFPDALRRLAHVELRADRVETAVQLAEQAFAADPSPTNESALAAMLLATEDAGRYTTAFSHAQAAARAQPDDAEKVRIYLSAAMATDNVDAMREAGAWFFAAEPEDPLAQFFGGILAAEDGRFEEAERLLIHARELGFPAEAVEQALAEGIRTRATIDRVLRVAGYSTAAWIVGLVVLTLLGLLLSKLTLAALARAKRQAGFETKPAEKVLRGIYRLDITLTSIYFYISIPFIILIIVALTLGIFYLFFVAGRVPIRLALIIGLAALYTLYAMVRSLLARVKETEPGRPLTEEEAPELWATVRSVAEQLAIRPVDAVYLTPLVEVAVMERGGMWKQIRNAGRRHLILGLGSLPDMTQGQFRAILAHEYGHFSNRDTAGGNLANRVWVSLNLMAYRLAASGQGRWYNPAWLFVQGFGRIYARVTLGASRLQEILADRYAAAGFGAENLINGLRHIIHQSLVFEVKVQSEIEAAMAGRRSLSNLYQLSRMREQDQLRDVQTREAEIMSRPTSPYDSHPAPADRIALLEQMCGGESVAASQEPAWLLLRNRQELQAEMTALVQKMIAQQPS